MSLKMEESQKLDFQIVPQPFFLKLSDTQLKKQRDITYAVYYQIAEIANKRFNETVFEIFTNEELATKCKQVPMMSDVPLAKWYDNQFLSKASIRYQEVTAATYRNNHDIKTWIETIKEFPKEQGAWIEFITQYNFDLLNEELQELFLTANHVIITSEVALCLENNTSLPTEFIESTLSKIKELNKDLILMNA